MSLCCAALLPPLLTRLVPYVEILLFALIARYTSARGGLIRVRSFLIDGRATISSSLSQGPTGASPKLFL